MDICRWRRPASQLLRRQPRKSKNTDADGTLPNLVVIGAAKCVTSSLPSCTDTHPEIRMSNLKEIEFFQDPRAEGWLGFYQTHFDLTAKASTVYIRCPLIPEVPPPLTDPVCPSIIGPKSARVLRAPVRCFEKGLGESVSKTRRAHLARLAAAVVDRLTFNAHIIQTGTQSYRLNASRKKQKRAAAR